MPGTKWMGAMATPISRTNGSVTRAIHGGCLCVMPCSTKKLKPLA